MGFGFNGVTGDYSQGAAGFWIEKGERVFPVSEITISANFDDLWKGIDAVGDDLDARSSVQCPSLRVAKMTVAGTSSQQRFHDQVVQGAVRRDDAVFVV